MHGWLPPLDDSGKGCSKHEPSHNLSEMLLLLLLGTYPAVALLDHGVIPCLILGGASILSSTPAAPSNTPTSSAWGSDFPRSSPTHFISWDGFGFWVSDRDLPNGCAGTSHYRSDLAPADG